MLDPWGGGALFPTLNLFKIRCSLCKRQHAINSAVGFSLSCVKGYFLPRRNECTLNVFSWVLVSYYSIYVCVFVSTVSPEAIVIPIVSCIIGFPLLALLVICCLRRRAKLARERARRRPGWVHSFLFWNFFTMILQTVCVQKN